MRDVAGLYSLCSNKDVRVHGKQVQHTLTTGNSFEWQASIKYKLDDNSLSFSPLVTDAASTVSIYIELLQNARSAL